MGLRPLIKTYYDELLSPKIFTVEQVKAMMDEVHNHPAKSPKVEASKGLKVEYSETNELIPVPVMSEVLSLDSKKIKEIAGNPTTIFILSKLREQIGVKSKLQFTGIAMLDKDNKFYGIYSDGICQFQYEFKLTHGEVFVQPEPLLLGMSGDLPES